MIFIICKGGYCFLSFEANRLTTVQSLWWWGKHWSGWSASSVPWSASPVPLGCGFTSALRTPMPLMTGDTWRFATSFWSASLALLFFFFFLLGLQTFSCWCFPFRISEIPTTLPQKYFLSLSLSLTFLSFYKYSFCSFPAVGIEGVHLGHG